MWGPLHGAYLMWKRDCFEMAGLHKHEMNLDSKAAQKFRCLQGRSAIRAAVLLAEGSWRTGISASSLLVLGSAYGVVQEVWSQVEQSSVRTRARNVLSKEQVHCHERVPSPTCHLKKPRPHLEGTHERVVHAHHRPRIVKLAAVVRGAKDGYQLPPRKKLVPLLHYLQSVSASSTK